MNDQSHGQDERAELLAIIRVLVGKRCWRVELSYGDELALDLGQSVLHSAGPLRGREHGEYQLSVLIDDWQLVNSRGEKHAAGDVLGAYEFDHSDESRARVAEYTNERASVLERLSAIVDSNVEDIQIGDLDLGLRVAFTDGWQLIVACSSPDPTGNRQPDSDSDPMACWELYLPNRSLSDQATLHSVPSWPLVKVMPGGRWTITSWGGP